MFRPGRKTKKLVKTFFMEGLNLLGRFKRTSGVPVLYYHSIDETDSMLSISEADFYWQMSYLRNAGFKVVSLSSLFERYSKKKRKPEKVAVLTFDDGFQNNFHKALPIVLEFGYSATVFLTTDYIGRAAAWIKRDLAEVIPNLSDLSLSDPENISRLEIDFSPLRTMYPFFAHLEDKELKEQLCKLNLMADFSLMTWEQVKEMSSYGIDFGAHSCSHPHLPRLGLKEIRKEVAESKALIESKIGRQVLFFCYPYGSEKVNSRMKQVVEEAGFCGACSTSPGLFDPGSDPYSIGRFYCGGINSNASAMKLCLSGLCHLYLSVQQLSRRRMCVQQRSLKI